MNTFIILFICVVPLVMSRANDEDQGILDTIKQYEKMEKHLQNSFDKLFHNFTTSSIKYKQKIVYTCNNACLENNDYEFGLTSAFLISVMAEKRFTVLSTTSYSMFHFYGERGYNWKLNKADINGKTGQLFFKQFPDQILQQTEKHLTEKDLIKMDFSLQPNKDFIMISGENNWILDLRRNPLSTHKLPWLYNAHACDVNRLVHAGLLQTPQNFHKNLTTLLENKVGRNNLICIHTNEKEIVKKSTVVDFLKRIMDGNSRHKIFLSNIDSKEFFDEKVPADKYFEDHVIHVDVDTLYEAMKYSDNAHHNFARFRNFVNTHILKLCDVLVTSESAIGIFAAHLRINSDMLFCYSDGLIHRCTRELIAGSFRKRTSDLRPMDLRILERRL